MRRLVPVLVTTSLLILACLGGKDPEGLEAGECSDGADNDADGLFDCDDDDCSGSPDCDTSVDSDGDGLGDLDEEALGTDPDDPDSDGDGWEDGEEVEGNTDPLDEADHPYTGGWPIDACRHDLSGQGWSVGQVVPAVELPDQFDEIVSLHDFCDHAILLTAYSYADSHVGDTSGVLDVHEQYADQGLVAVIALMGGGHGDVERLASSTDDVAPILDDRAWDLYYDWDNEVILIGAGGVVQKQVSSVWDLSTQDVEAALP